MSPQSGLFEIHKRQAQRELPLRRCLVCRELRPVLEPAALASFHRCAFDPPWIFRGDLARCSYGRTAYF